MADKTQKDQRHPRSIYPNAYLKSALGFTFRTLTIN
jgi:hypothetical protein